MIAYHLGDGEILPLATSESSADKIYFKDTIQIGADNVQTAIENVKNSLEAEFGMDIDAIYDAIVAKGVVPVDKSVQELVYAIYQITTDTKHVGVYNATSRDTYVNDMGTSHIYRYVNTASVPNLNTSTYTFEEGSMGQLVDLSAGNNVRYIDATEVYNKGYDDGSNYVRENITTYSIRLTGDMGPVVTQSFAIPSDVVGFSVSGACGVRLISSGQPGVEDVQLIGKVIYPRDTHKVFQLYYYNGEGDSQPGEGHLVIPSDGGDGYVVEVHLDVSKLTVAKYAAFATAFITMWR